MSIDALTSSALPKCGLTLKLIQPGWGISMLMLLDEAASNHRIVGLWAFDSDSRCWTNAKGICHMEGGRSVPQS
jgi:hypothetical protein